MACRIQTLYEIIGGIMRFFLIISICFITAIAYADSLDYDIEWQTKFDKHKNAKGNDIIQTTDGGFIICGETSKYGGKLLIIKTDSNGVEQWSKKYIGCAYSIKQTHDKGYIVSGNAENNALVLKIDHSGNIQWEKTFGEKQGACAYSIQQSADMGYIFCGKKRYKNSLRSDLWVVKLDEIGNQVWDKTYGSNYDDHGNCIIQTIDGGYAICGVKKYDLGFLHVIGQLWILKLNNAGTIQWERTYNENEFIEGTSITQTINGGYAICGNQGPGNIIVLTTNYKGNKMWDRYFTGTWISKYTGKERTNDHAKSIIQSDCGDLLVCGDQGRKEPPQGGKYWLISLNQNAEMEWEKIFSDNYYGQYATKIIQTDDGGLVCYGNAEIDGRATNNITLLKLENPDFTAIRNELLNLMRIEISELSSFFGPIDEFETENEYKNRVERGNKEKNDINKKYDILIDQAKEEFAKNYIKKIAKKNQEIDYEIRLSIEEITMEIEKIGEYNAENETFPITIDGFTENVFIPRTEARSFKENSGNVQVTGYKRLYRDLQTYENYNLMIIHPVTGNQFAFGEHRSLYKIPDKSLITISTEHGNIRKKPSTNSIIIKKSSKGDTFPVISFNRPWYNIKIDNKLNGFVHQSICSESQVQTKDIAIEPPYLKLSAELIEPSGNGFLDGEEKGKIIVKINNSGKGPAFGVIVDINNSLENPNLIYSRTRVPGEISPDETKEISFDIEANKNIGRSTQSFTISALESNGFSPESILLTFETHPILLPEISMIDYGVNTASGDSEIIPGETTYLKLRFQNIEQGKAENLNFKMNLPNNVYFNPESKKAFSFATLNSGEYKDIEFSILTSNEVNEQIELVISMNEKHISKKYSLILEINKPLKSIQEFVQKGIEENINPIVIASELTADIARNIPTCKLVNSDAIAVVIGNRNYLKAKNVEYAINDAILMKEYLINSFGYKEGNIFFLKNASKGDLELYFGTKDNYKGKLYNTVKENKSDIYIYYSGHGAPSLNNKKGYFVPVECDPNYVELSGYSLQTFYDNLSKIPAKSQIIVLDACFSGADIFENISPIITKTDNPIISLNNGIVFSSSKDTEVSSWYNEKKHGMFTYFFLKSIHDKNADLNNNNKLTANEIIKFISSNSEGVPYYSRRIHGVEQNPQLFGKNKERIIVNYE